MHNFLRNGGKTAPRGNDMNFLSFLEDRIAVFDGAFGTVLQQKVGNAGPVPEKLNIERPEVIAEIHREYAEAGADIITANTFGANEIKAGSRELADALIRAGVDVARRAAPGKFVALDIGPLGRLLEPMGDISFRQAYEAYAHAVEAGKGADLILIETMSDLQELRAALLAAREHSDLPVLCSMTFDGSGRTFMGCDPVCFALTASPLADAIGVNCSLGPKQLLPVVKTILRNTAKPVLVQPNAGLPDEKMHYDVSAEEFAEASEEFLKAGARIVGGCCGTSPEYTRRLRALADKYKPQRAEHIPRPSACTATTAVFFDGVTVAGERINPTGKAELEEALRAGDFWCAADMAMEQADAGAELVDVNTGVPGIDEAETLAKAISEIQSACRAPLLLDSSDPAALAAALRVYCGKAVVNSVTGADESLRAILPLAKKYGAAVIGLTMDERGIPATAEERVKIAEKIIAAAEGYGIAREDIFIDCITMPAATNPGGAQIALDALREVKRRLHVKTALGISNISYGMPARGGMNAAYLSAAVLAGLDLPILNPCDDTVMRALASAKAVACGDEERAEYIEKFRK